MLAFMGDWPFWAIHGVVGAAAGLTGGAAGYFVGRGSRNISGFCVIAALAIVKPVTDNFIIPRVVNDSANAELPKKVDDITTMTKVVIEKKTVKYSFDIDPSLKLVSGSEMKAALKPAACGYWKPKFASGEFLSAEYGYSFVDGASSFVLTQSDCP